jgi:hypothetical protein
MASKRSLKAGEGPSRFKRPTKKQRRLDAYHSESDDDAGQAPEFQAVNLEDSGGGGLDDEVEGDASDGDAGEGPYSGDEGDQNVLQSKHASRKHGSQRPDAQAEAHDSRDDSGAESDAGSDTDTDSDASSGSQGNPNLKARSKRNDPAAFATSLARILGTKLSTARRADPVLAGSAAAHAAARTIAESALDAKARKQLRETKRAATEKGRIRNVLAPISIPAAAVAGAAPASASASASASGSTVPGAQGTMASTKGGVAAGVVGGEISTAQLLETERRLRKVAQRGVVKLFNAVRAAQVKAAEAERAARAEGVVGQGAREERVAEMSRKGFLDLIAQGGGKMKKGALEEA